MLLYKLQMHGIQVKTLLWIQSFLVERSQRVLLEGECSDEVPVSSDVPQGSVLGPILFLLYINDLPDNVQSQVRLFADDTAVYLAINHPEDSALLQRDLDLLQLWETQRDMEFNQTLHTTRARTPIKTPYNMHNQVLDSVSSARYLCVQLSTNLNFNSHIQRISCNANKSLGYIKRNIRPKHPGVREAAYKILVRPQLEYGSTVWSPYTQSNIHKIEMVQRRAIRWTLRNYSPYESVIDMQLSLGWRFLEQRREMRASVSFTKLFMVSVQYLYLHISSSPQG